MARMTTTRGRLGGALSEFGSANVGEGGTDETVGDHARDHVRRDEERVEREAFERLKAELSRAFAAPESSYEPLTAAEVVARNRP